MEKKRVVIVSSNDWEGIYIDELLIDEGHTLGEGGNFTYLLELSEKFDFKYKDVISIYLNEKDIKMTEDKGSFPKFLTGFKGKYDEV